MNKKKFQTPEIEYIELEIANVILDSTLNQHGKQDGQQLPEDNSGFPA